MRSFKAVGIQENEVYAKTASSRTENINEPLDRDTLQAEKTNHRRSWARGSSVCDLGQTCRRPARRMCQFEIEYDAEEPLFLSDHEKNFEEAAGIDSLVPIWREEAAHVWNKSGWYRDIKRDAYLGDVLALRTEDAEADGWSSFGMWN